MTKEREIEQLEEQRARIYGVYLVSIGTALERELLAELDEIDKRLDELEGIEPEEELDYTNDTQHWDEWVADQKFDQYRDSALMGYEY